jgi:hypothetical protein
MCKLRKSGLARPEEVKVKAITSLARRLTAYFPKTLIITLPLILLIHCKDSPPDTLPAVIIKENLHPVNVKFVLEKRIPLTNINYPAIFVGDKEVFAYGFSMDDDNPKAALLEIYDKDLNFQAQKFFPYGQGPGDIGTGFHIYKSGDQVYIPDQTQQRVNIFDKDFNFKKFIISGSGIFTFIENGKYMIKSSTFNDYKHQKRIPKIALLSFPDLKKKLLKELEPHWPLDERGRIVQFAGTGFHYFYHQSIIYILEMKSYNISTYDLMGSPLKSVTVDVKPEHLSDEIREEWLKELRGGEYEQIKGRIFLPDVLQPASFMIPLGKGFAVIRRETYLLNCRGKAMVTADYFDFQLNLKGQIQIPCFYRIFEVSQYYIPVSTQYNDGFLYLVGITDDEDFYLEKWQVLE